jgi:hypothetical protein
MRANRSRSSAVDGLAVCIRLNWRAWISETASQARVSGEVSSRIEPAACPRRRMPPITSAAWCEEHSCLTGKPRPCLRARVLREEFESPL